ncbi:MAG: PAS domain S-box protein [Microcoleaceae cyanobacterium]
MLTSPSQLTTQTRLLLEQLPSAIALFDEQMHYIMASYRWRELLNLGARVLEGQSYSHTFSPLPLNWSTLIKQCLSGSPQSWQTQQIQPEQNQSKSLNWQATPWYNEMGKVGGITVSVEAVIEEKKVDNPPELQTFKQFQQLADNVPGMIYQFRLSPDGTRTFPYISSGCRYTYELEPKQVQQQPELLFEVVHPDDQTRIENTIQYSAKTLTRWEAEWRILTPTGQLKWLKGISKPQYQPDGAILWDGCVIDISQRKIAEIALKQLNEELEIRVQERTTQLQQSLKNLEDLKLALNQSAIVAITDTKGIITDVNDQFCQISGYSRKELIGKNHHIVNSGYHSKTFFRKMWRTISRGKIWRGEIKNKAKEGSSYWVDTIIVPLLNHQNQPYQYISISYDISDRKQTEIALQKSQAQLETFINHAPAVIFLKSLKGEYIITNRVCEQVLQASPGELIGKTDRDLFPPEAATAIQHTDQKAWKTGEVVYLEETVPLADGEHIYETIKFPVADTNGTIYAVGGVSTDITSRKRAENALKQSEAHFQRLTANIPGMLYQLRRDADGSISYPYVSSGCRDVFGIEAEQLQQDASLLKIHPEDQAEVMTAVTFSAQTLQNWKHEWRAILPSKEVKWVQAIARPERQADGSVIWDGCLIDISDRKRTEEQLHQFQQRLSLMVEQTPLAVVEWNTQMEITAWNPAAERIFGYSTSEAIGQHMNFFLSEAVRQQLKGINAELVMQQGGRYQINENLRKDGQIIICEWYNTPLVTPEGEVIGIASHALDITERKQAELKLQHTTAELQEAQKLAHIGNWNYEIATGEIQWSKEVFRIYGLDDNTSVPSFEEVMALSHPEDLEWFYKVVTEAANEGISYDVEVRMIRASGEIRHVNAKGQAVSNEQGQVIRLFGTLMDITERKKAEAERQKLISIIEASSDFIAFATLENQLVYVNPAGLEMVGLNNIEEAQTKKVTDFYYPKEIQLLEDKILPEVLKKGTWQGELQFQHFQTGCLIPVDETIFTVSHPETGEAMGIATITRDITERKKAEAAFEKTTRDLQQAQRIAHIGNWEYNAVTEQLTWSQEVFRLFNRPLEQGIPSLSEAIEYYYPEDIPRLQQALNQMIATGEAIELELRVGTDEDLHYVNIKTEAVQNQQGEVTGLFGTIMDITARKQAEIQLQQQAEILQNTLKELQRTQAQMLQNEKMSSLGQMVGGVAHEINNPVSFIHGNLTHASDYIQDLFELLDLYQEHYPEPAADIQELLEEIELEFLKEDFSKLLKSMKIGTERIRQIVLSLRNFSRLDEAEFKRANIHDGINSTLMILKNRLSDVEVITEYADLPEIECYPGQLNQVFMNILDNGIDALEKNSDHQEIRIQTDRIDSNWIRIRIANSGYEISKSICDKVFDPFFTTKPIGQGTGLGLSISYQIITDKHHGKIDCYPVPGKGTEFMIEIPVRQTDF